MLIKWLQLMFHCTGVAVVPLLALLQGRGHSQLHQACPMVEVALLRKQQLLGNQQLLESQSLVHCMISEGAPASERKTHHGQRYCYYYIKSLVIEMKE